MNQILRALIPSNQALKKIIKSTLRVLLLLMGFLLTQQIAYLRTSRDLGAAVEIMLKAEERAIHQCFKGNAEFQKAHTNALYFLNLQIQENAKQIDYIYEQLEK